MIIASVNIKVLQNCSAEEIAAVFIPREVELGWTPGALDHVSVIVADIPIEPHSLGFTN